MPQDGGAGAVPEEDTGVALRPVGDRGQFFRTDYEYSVVGVAGDKLLRDFDREKESRASRRDVEASRSIRPDLCLNKAGRGGKYHVGSGRGDEDEIDFIARDAGLFHRGKGGFGAHVERTEDFARAFDEAVASGLPAIIELSISPEALTPAASLSETRSKALAARGRG